ncbi:MAG TPA: phosphate ABC transporter substrate-binding protein [Rhizobiaceae bacterium]|nr:phosphate ABC transporter substrate-binding protein [Rhizobiaceae bacterium]
MIAALPMYDWPEECASVDAKWARLRSRLVELGLDAPDFLTRGDDFDALWLSPKLMLAQTCAYPLETRLAGKVRYVATPHYDAPGCTPGHYRSVIVVAGAPDDSLPPSNDGAPDLPPMDRMRLAFNGRDSLSGFVSLMRDCEMLGLDEPAPALETGAHRASIRAVAEGKADVAAIDCVTWQLALTHEPAALDVRVAGWTGLRPALPFITRLDCPDDELTCLRMAAGEQFGAVVLDQPVDRPV